LPPGAASFAPRGPLRDVKLVLVVRSDLKMTTGKIASQVASPSPFCGGHNAARVRALTGPLIRTVRPRGSGSIHQCCPSSAGSMGSKQSGENCPAGSGAERGAAAMCLEGQIGRACIPALFPLVRSFPVFGARKPPNFDSADTWSCDCSISWLQLCLICCRRRQLNKIEASARRSGISTHAVADAGRTQIAAGSITVLACGPAPAMVLDAVTGRLRLL